MLHEGLGSVGLWGDFPDKLQTATGSACSRIPAPATAPHAGRAAASARLHAARSVRRAAELLETIGFRRGLLAGPFRRRLDRGDLCRQRQDHRVQGIALIAPHFIVEDISVGSIAEIRTAYETTTCARSWRAGTRMSTTPSMAGTAHWLDPGFRDWDISEYLAYIRVPVAVLQGVDDQYGTMRQVEIAQEECYCPVDVTVVPGAGHQPHREAPGATLDAISEFANAVLHVDAARRAGRVTLCFLLFPGPR